MLNYCFLLAASRRGVILCTQVDNNIQMILKYNLATYPSTPYRSFVIEMFIKSVTLCLKDKIDIYLEWYEDE